MSEDIRAHVTADARGQWLVLTDEADIDDAQASGRWLKIDSPREVPA
jgi:hypothetical protein